MSTASVPGGNSTDNSSGVVALVSGIVGIFACPIIFSIIAIIFGRKGMAANQAGTANNAGVAKAGYYLGIIGLILGVIGILIVIIVAATSAGS